MTDGQRVHVLEKQWGKGLMLQITSFPFYSGCFKAVDLMEWFLIGAGALIGESGPWGLVTSGWQHCRYVANKVLIGYQGEDESSYKQLVKRQHCTPKSCKWRALWLGGEASCTPSWFTAESHAVNVFCREAAFSSSVLFMQTAESGRKLRHLINGCGCGSVSHVFLRAHIQRQNPSAGGYRISFFFSSETLSKLWPLNFSILFPFPPILFHIVSSMKSTSPLILAVSIQNDHMLTQPRVLESPTLENSREKRK